MKILVAGDWQFDIYEKSFFDAFLQLGQEVYCFSFSRYFQSESSNFLFFLFAKIQNKFSLGPLVFKLNKDFGKYCREISPDLVFIYRGKFIYPSTISVIKKTGALVFGYNNDDPFSEKYPFYFWRYFKKSIPYYDHIFAYRPKNIEDEKKIGYHNVSLLRSYYIRENNFPLEKLPTNKYVCDVIFAGHYENDGRDEYIKAIIDAGINFKLFGPEWHRSKYYQFFKEKLGEIYPLNEDYNLALNSAKIALVFLSKLNNDTYTRRCFEITATKTFMLSEYSDDLDSLFKQGKEAEYFKTKEEMLEKIKYYLDHDKEREKIAEAGYERLLKDGHEVLDRAKEIISVFKQYKTL